MATMVYKAESGNLIVFEKKPLMVASCRSFYGV